MKQIAFIGLGNFGFALLKHFDVKNEDLRKKKIASYVLNGFDKHPEVIESLSKNHHHPYLFKDQSVSQNIFYFKTIKETVKEADYIILSVSSTALNEVFVEMKDSIKQDAILINTSKALESKNGKRFSQVAEEILGDINYSLLVGGTHARDVFALQPLGATIACTKSNLLPDLQKLFTSYNLSVYPSSDLVGIEYASAFKNVISILAGIIKGMKYAYGSETYVISRAADEVEQLIVGKLGGKKETFAMGYQCWGNDLWMSCTANTRNREFGTLIGKGHSLEEAVTHMKQEGKTVEGVNTGNILSKIADISSYPLIFFMQNLFTGKAKADDLKSILFNHEF